MEELSQRFLSDGCFAPAAYYYTLLKDILFYFRLTEVGNKFISQHFNNPSFSK